MTKPIAALLLASSAILLAAAQQAQEGSAAKLLWRDPGPIESKDLFWGAGGEDRQPQPPFAFVKEDLSGSKPKLRVTDARGTAWNVKLAGQLPEKNEVNAEVAANRIAWAFGYLVEEDYFLPEGRIENAKGLSRAAASIGPDGTFHTARFERRAPESTRTGRRWSLDSNPFVGSKELSGLKLVLALVNNWDNKPDNTSIEHVTSEGVAEDRYLFSDWGASFGRMAGPPTWSPAPTRWQVRHYQEQPYTAGVANGMLRLNFIGQVPLAPIPIDHAQWFAGLAGQLRQEQVEGAFKAAGASPSDAQGFAARVIEKVKELQTALRTP
jgi:hypothetical protein